MAIRSNTGLALVLLLLDTARHLPRIPTDLRLSLHHIREPDFLPASLLAQISHIGNAPALQMPLLDTPNDVHAELPVGLQCVFPVRGNGVRQRQITCHGSDHHFAHFVVLACVGVDVLHAAEGRVGFVRVVEGTQRVDGFFGEASDFQLLREEV